MDYFFDKWHRNAARRYDELPSWLPKSGLDFWEDFTEPHDRALTGQRITYSTDADHDPITFPKLGGKYCMYKEGSNNIVFASPMKQSMSTNYTLGVWVYDHLGTCNNQQVSNLTVYNPSSYSVMLNHKATNGKYRLGMWNGSSTVSYVDGSASVKQRWDFMVIRQNASNWEFWLNGSKVGSANRTNAYGINNLRFLHNNCFGVAVRCAFFYTRAITDAEMATIYSNSENWKATRLPDGYDDYKYLQCSGAQNTYIDTGLTGRPTLIELTAALASGVNSKPPFGTGKSKTEGNYSLWLHNENSRKWVEAVYGNGNDSNYLYTYDVNVLEPHTYTIYGSLLFVDGVNVGNASRVGGSYSYKFAIAGCWRGSALNTSFQGYLGDVKISGVTAQGQLQLVRHYIPAKRLSDNATGMYDIITDTFTALSGSSVVNTI